MTFMTGLRVFVCEFVTGGGFIDTELPGGLHREGDMMLRALVKDLSDVPGVSVVVTRDRRLPACELPAEIRTIEASRSFCSCSSAALRRSPCRRISANVG
jgi:hypothetical protein